MIANNVIVCIIYSETKLVKMNQEVDKTLFSCIYFDCDTIRRIVIYFCCKRFIHIEK